MKKRNYQFLLERISQNGGLENARTLFDETTKQMEMLREEKKYLSRGRETLKRFLHLLF